MGAPNKSWLVSFSYGAEDFGVNREGISRASIHITIFDDDGVVTNISLRNGYIKLGYNKEDDKYFIEDRRQ